MISVYINNKIVANNLYLPATGAMKKWKAVELKNVHLSGNADQIVIKATRGGFNFRQIEFIRRPSK